MRRYIDVDEYAKKLLIKKHEVIKARLLTGDEVAKHMWDSVVNTMNECCVILESMPTADVRENVKGEWIVDDPRSEHCSNCGHEYYITSLFMVGINDEPPFCPNCGADMRGEA